ncbi:ATP-binding protein [Luteimonas sp. MC1825]|uniref:ATP-binding protein n=1 Tax=Luteimonas sp. MC1825 TaxID=2761107 RepID=UPI001612F50B|nr:ATP-binding protein [Luteimonas sp. MC1825]MBB6599611.1 ATP-binding protein [Luteimonas sp. MC1825]QOC87303.1 ATP-binding protein [Luteimonas sp. MC1825]
MNQVQTLEVIPDPVSLIESMRAVGYSVEAAVADIVDNSLSAGAAEVRIQYDATASPFVAILDDGAGMAPDELTGAMRHGSSNPADRRGANDLGRFGLGLKTASLSQCRKLTVISSKGGTISARRWDLDVVRQTGRWLVVVPEKSEFETLPMFGRLREQKSGTLVVWQELDRLTAGAGNLQQEMTAKMEPLLEHLALVFHRFMQREAQHPKIFMAVNGMPLPHRDPFLASSQFRQELEGQTIRHERGTVEVSPYILPPISRLSEEEIVAAGGRDGLRGTQGFYVYRGRRLVIWGTWFRLVPKHEVYKLTRVKVDIPNSFDELWALDIKKSAAYPPDAIRSRLKLLIPHFADKSRKAVVYPGRRAASNPAVVPLWDRIEPRHGSFSYQVNTDHPLISRLSESLDADQQHHMQIILEYLGTSLPYDQIYADMCGDQPREAGDNLDQLADMARSLLELTGLSIARVLGIDPLARFPALHDAIKERLADV